MKGQEYVNALRMQLDSISNEDDVHRLLVKAVNDLRVLGYSDDEILSFFQRVYIKEAQQSTNMIANHQKYKEMVAKILGGKK